MEENAKTFEENFIYQRVHTYGVDEYHVKTDWIAKLMVVPAGVVFVYIIHLILNMFKALIYTRHTSVFGYDGEGWFDLLVILYILDIYGCSSQNSYLFMREVTLAKIRQFFSFIRCCKKRQVQTILFDDLQDKGQVYKRFI